VIRLAAHGLDAARGGVTLDTPVELAKGRAPVDGRLTRAQEIEVRPVKHEDAPGSGTCHGARSIH